MASAGTAYVDLQPDLGGFFAQIEGKLAPLTDKFGPVGKAAAAGLGVVAVAGAAAGKALYEIGESFDDAYDQIRVQTGATGKELEGLKGSFKNVVSSVPTDFDSAAKAVGQLNSRLGLSGKPLEQLSKQILELSRITNTDLETNIESVTRVFGDWGVTVKEQRPALDELYRASQETGVGVSRLADLMTKFGSPMRQLGFSFEETAGLVGKFEKEGVNTELVLGSMRIALGKLASEGVKDPAKALEQLTSQIKNAGSAGKANAMAIETFGARAGPDMAAAIREGRFDLGKLFETIKNGSDTVMKSGRDTRDFSEQWQMFKNKVLVALEPVAIRVFGAVGDGMKWLNKNWPAIVASLRKATEWLKQAWEDLGPAIKVVWEVIKYTLGVMKARFQQIFDFIAGAVEIFIGAIHGDFSKMWDGIKRIFKALVTDTIKLMGTMLKPAGEVASAIAGAIMDGLSAVAEFPKNLVGWMKDGLAAIGDYLDRFKDKAVQLGGKIVGGIGEGIKDLVSKLGDVLGKALDKVVSFFDRFKDRAVQLGGKIVSGLASGISDLVEKVATTLGKVVDKIGDYFTTFLSKATQLGNKIVSGVGEGITDLVTKVGNKISGVVDEVGSWFDRMYDKADQLGGKILRGIVDGLGDVAKTIGNAIKSAFTTVGDLIGDAGQMLVDWINDNTLFGNTIHISVPGPIPDVNIKLPALASGATDFSGVALVGEEGPELVNFGRPADIYPAPDTARLLAQFERSQQRVGNAPVGDLYADIYIGGERIDERVRVQIRERDRSTNRRYRAGVIA